MTGADGRVDVENFLGKPREYDDLLAVSQAYAWGWKNELPANLRSVSTRPGRAPWNSPTAITALAASPHSSPTSGLRSGRCKPAP